MSFKPELLVPEHIKRFEPYIPSKPLAVLKKLYGVDKLHRLNNNENPLGPPATSRRIIDGFLPVDASIYPSGDAYYVKLKLAEKFGLQPEQFLVGNGANEVIAFVIKAFCAEGDNIITADKTFAVYEWVAKFSGVDARLIHLKDFCFDDEAMLNAIDDRTKIIFVCNPNNPTGTYWSRERLIRFLDAVGPSKIVVLDEAYIEFVEKEDFPDGMKLLETYSNLVVFRTFSKIYALAGLRIGYLASSREVVDIIRRTCIVYSVNTLAQAAAVAALEDEEHVHHTRQIVHEGKKVLTEALDSMGLPYLNNEGNFIMIESPVNDSLLYRKLMGQGFVIRPMTSFRYPNYIRVTIFTADIMAEFADALEKTIK
jgi:histidinol-phosphate aminotransferase